MDKIYVNGMLFYGYHGVFEEETKLGQRFIVDVVAEVDLKKPGTTDDLNYSVHYGEIYAACREVVEGKPYQLIESVAEAVSQRLLTQFPLILQCTVKVIKPDPPIPGYYESVAVEITRGRER
ncbi:MAG: dihydroneopterin aldolase [Bacilli bacterium]